LGEDIEQLESDLHIHGLGEEDAAEAWEHELDQSIQVSHQNQGLGNSLTTNQERSEKA